MTSACMPSMHRGRLTVIIDCTSLAPRRGPAYGLSPCILSHALQDRDFDEQ
jgi:hypothetical protein